MVRNLFAAALLAGFAFGLPQTTPNPKGNTKGYPFVDPLSDYRPPPNPYNTNGQFINWKTYNSNGANLGSWLEKERTHDPIWWVSVGGENATDEWVSHRRSSPEESFDSNASKTLCKILGKRCGPIFEARYASFLNFTTIDDLASVGVNTLRIPTTYAAWVKVPGSQFHSGNQVQFLDRIVTYAVQRYNMHIIIGLHSLPGGVNSLDIGEGFGRDGWFFNQTNLDYSWEAVDRILDYIKASPLGLNKFTIGPINEASDTHLVGFGTPAGLTDEGVAWVNKYHYGVLERIRKVDSRIPMMIQDCFKGTSFWVPFYNATDNVVMSAHVYYFAANGVYSNYVNPAVCGQAQFIANQTTFGNFVGEWSLQTTFNNTFANRESIFNTERYAWSEYLNGGCKLFACSDPYYDADRE